MSSTSAPVPMPAPPGNTGTIAGICLIVLGPVLGVLIIVATTITFVNAVDTATKLMADGRPAQVSLHQGQPAGLWLYEHGSGYCWVISPSGVKVTLDTFDVPSQSVNDYTLVAVFAPPVDGTYTVACDPDNAVFPFKIAPPRSNSGFLGGLTAGIVVIPVAVIAGVVLLITTGVRRKHWSAKHTPVAPQAPAWGQTTPGQPYPPGPVWAFPGPTPPPGQPIPTPGQPYYQAAAPQQSLFPGAVPPYPPPGQPPSPWPPPGPTPPSQAPPGPPPSPWAPPRPGQP